MQATKEPPKAGDLIYEIQSPADPFFSRTEGLDRAFEPVR